MELKLATDAQLALAYRRDLKPSFPAAELPPLKAFRALVRTGAYRPWCLFDGDALAGEAFVYAVEPGYVMFDYLCVARDRRNGGLGSLLIGKLLEAERGSVVFGESEIPRYAPDPAMAARRIAFYKRNGALQAGYDSCIYGVAYHTLFWTEGETSDEALCAVHRTAWRKRLPPLFYQKHVSIPWSAPAGATEETPGTGLDA